MTIKWIHVIDCDAVSHRCQCPIVTSAGLPTTGGILCICNDTICNCIYIMILSNITNIHGRVRIRIRSAIFPRNGRINIVTVRTNTTAAIGRIAATGATPGLGST